jgi:hypothetical protein
MQPADGLLVTTTVWIIQFELWLRPGTVAAGQSSQGTRQGYFYTAGTGVSDSVPGLL